MDLEWLIFYGIDQIEGHWRSSNLKQEIFKDEERWVFELGALAPQGLNVDLDLIYFIDNYWIYNGWFCIILNKV